MHTTTHAGRHRELGLESVMVVFWENPFTYFYVGKL